MKSVQFLIATFVGTVIMGGGAAQAATWTVTTPSDGFNGACTLSLCTLRDAVHAANLNPGDDVVEIPAHIGLIYITESCFGLPEDGNLCGDIDIWDAGSLPSELRIVGLAGTPVDNTVASGLSGVEAERLFHILPPSEETTAPKVIFESVQLTGGEQLASTGGPFGGGCVANESVSELEFEGSRIIGCLRRGASAGGSRGGGAIDTLGPLSLVGSEVAQNISHYAGGGAISASAEVSILNGFVSGNGVLLSCGTCSGAGGAIFMDTPASLFIEAVQLVTNEAPMGGGAIYHAGGPLELRTVRLENNNGGQGQGGALWSLSIEPVLFRVDVGGNTTEGLGGGASLIVPSGSGPFIDRSSFWNNVSGASGSAGSGGGLLLRGQSGGSLSNTIRNSTFSGNQATDGRGGAIRLLGPGTGHALELEHVTLYENTADWGKELHANSAWSVELASTVLFTLDLDDTDCEGGAVFFTDGAVGYNHAFETDSGCGLDTDVYAPHPLGALDYYGNFTKARPIVSSGDQRRSNGAACPPVDQHGNSRPTIDCSIGALEF